MAAVEWKHPIDPSFYDFYNREFNRLNVYQNGVVHYPTLADMVMVPSWAIYWSILEGRVENVVLDAHQYHTVISLHTADELVILSKSDNDRTIQLETPQPLYSSDILRLLNNIKQFIEEDYDDLDYEGSTTVVQDTSIIISHPEVTKLLDNRIGEWYSHRISDIGAINDYVTGQSHNSDDNSSLIDVGMTQVRRTVKNTVVETVDGLIAAFNGVVILDYLVRNSKRISWELSFHGTIYPVEYYNTYVRPHIEYLELAVKYRSRLTVEMNDYLLRNGFSSIEDALLLLRTKLSDSSYNWELYTF